MHCRYTLTNSHAPRTTTNPLRPTCNTHDNNTYGTDTGHGDTARTQSLATRLSRRAAGLMLFLVALTTGLSSTAYAAPTTLDATARVYLGFEKRELTLEQADDIINNRVGGYDVNNRWGDGYVGLWVYAYFDIDHFSQFVGKSMAQKPTWPLNYSGNVTWKVEHQDGTIDRSKTIAYTLPQSQHQWEPCYTEFWVQVNNFSDRDPADGGGPGNGWAQTATTTTGRSMNNPFEKGSDCPHKAIDTVEIDGKKFFRVKFFEVRFAWESAQSFYVSPYCSEETYNDGANGSTEFNLTDANGDVVYLCNTWGDFVMASGSNPKYPNRACTNYNFFRQGGVVIKNEGFAGAVTPPTQTVCPNDDAEATLRITRWHPSGGKWEDGVNGSVRIQYYDPTIPGTNKWTGTQTVAESETAAAGGQPYITGKENETVSPSDAAPTLVKVKIPVAYHKATYDSFQLAVRITKGNTAGTTDSTYTFPFGVKYKTDPKLKIAFADRFPALNIPISIYGKKTGVGGQKDTIVGIADGALVTVGTADRYPNSSSSKYTTTGQTENTTVVFPTMIPVSSPNPKLYYAPSLSESFSEEAREGDLVVQRFVNYTVTKSGYYFLSYVINGCTLYTDTVYVKVKKLLPAPSLSYSTGGDCDAVKLDMAVDAIAPNGRADGWEWVLGTLQDEAKEIISKDPKAVKPWVSIPNGVEYNAGGAAYLDPDNGLVLTFKTTKEGDAAGRFALGTMNENMKGQILIWRNECTIGDGVDAMSCWESFTCFAGDADGGMFEDLVGLWPSPDDPANAAKEIKFSGDDYSVQFFCLHVFYARYWTADGDTSEWGYFYDNCNTKTIPRGLSAGITATQWPAPVSHYGERTVDTTVDQGGNVKLKCFVTYPLDDNFARWADVGDNLADKGIAALWQVQAADGSWNTWHISGAGSTDKGTLLEYVFYEDADVIMIIPYIEATRTNITKTETHRVIFRLGACEWNPAESTCNKVYHGNGTMAGWPTCELGEDDFGDYATECTITVGDKPGTLNIAKTGETIDKTEVEICDGEKIDLALDGATFPDGTTLTWEQTFTPEDEDSWEDAIGITTPGTSKTVTGITPGVISGLEEDYKLAVCSFDGLTFYYRVKIDGFTDPVGVVSVKVRKAPEIYIDATNQNGQHKAKDIGYCSYDVITIKPATETAGIDLHDFQYEYQKKPSINDFVDDDLDASTGTDAGLQYSGSAASGYHRIKAMNGECPDYSDPVYIKINDAIDVAIAPDTTVCAGSQVTVRVTTATTGIKYNWNFAGTKETNTSATATKTFPLEGTTPEEGKTENVCVTLSKLYGTVSANTEDTLTCYSKNECVTIRTTICKPTVGLWGEETICAGSPDTLFWIIDNNFDEFECGTDNLSYSYSTDNGNTWSAYNPVPASDYTCKNVNVDGQDATFMILKSTSAITNTPGQYKFKAAKNGVGSESDPTEGTLTVLGKPAFTVNSFATVQDNTFCVGTSKGIKGTVKATATATGGTYTFIWKKDGVTEGTSTQDNNGSQVTSTFDFVPSTQLLTLDDTGVYTVWVVLKNGDCVSDTAKKDVTVKWYRLVPAVVTMPQDTIEVCSGGTVTVHADYDSPYFEGTATGETGFATTYTWRREGGTGCASSSSPSFTYEDLVASSSSQPCLPTAEGYYGYYISIQANSNRCWSVASAIPEVKQVVHVVPCADPEVTEAKACPADAAGKTFTLTCPPSVTGITFPNDDLVFVSPTDFTSGTTSYTIKPKNAPTTPGEHTYSITVSMPGNTTRTLTAKFTIYPVPDFTVGVNSHNVCPGTDVQFTATVTPTAGAAAGANTGNTYIYSWQGRGASWSTGSSNKTNTFAAISDSMGTYTATVTATNSNSCKATVTSNPGGTLTLKNLPAKPTIGEVAAPTFCANSESNFEIPVSGTEGTVTYTWEGSVGNTGSYSGLGASNSNTLKICKQGSTSCSGGAIMPANGQWGLRLIITSDNGCVRKDTAAVVATIVSAPTVSVSGQNVSACEGSDTTLKVTCDLGTNETITGYKWTYGGSVISGATTDTYKVTNVTNSNPGKNTGDYTVDVTVKNTVTGCSETGNAKITLTGTANPTITKSNLNAAKDKLCTNESLSLTADFGVVPNTSTPTYRWYKGKITDTSASTRLSATGDSYTKATPDPTTDGGWYTVVVTYKSGDCYVTGYAEKEVTVLQKPDITSVTITPTPDPATICSGNDFSFTATVVPATASAGSYTYKWYKGSTELTTGISNGGLTYSKTNAVSGDADTYKFEVTATNDICETKADGSIVVKVTTPVDLSGISITDKQSDYCIDKGEHELSLGSSMPTIPTGATVTYEWYRDATLLKSGSTTADAKLVVPAQLSNSGTYKVRVKVENNPCTSLDSATKEINFKICGEEALTPGTAPEQNNALAIICQRGDENSAASVSFNTTIEKDAVTKVTWMKYTTQPAAGNTDDGDEVKVVNVSSSTPWPLTLTHSEVFVDNTGNPENAPKNYYVRVKIERGSVVSFSGTYRFVKLPNADKATDLSMNETSKTVCKGDAFDFVVTATAPTAPTAYTGIAPYSDPLLYMWKKPAASEAAGSQDNTMTATTSAAVTEDPYAARVVSTYRYVAGSLTRYCRDTAGPVTGKITVKDPPSATLTIDPTGPVCDNNIPNTIKLKVNVTNGEIKDWKRSASGSKTLAATPLSAAGTLNEYTLDLTNDLLRPDAGASLAVTNTYTVTVGYTDACTDITPNVNFVVNPVPTLASVEIVADATYCNNEAHTLEAKPKNASGNEITTYTGYTWKWEVSTDGTSWTTAEGSSGGRTYSIPSGKAAGTYTYRCTATVSMGSGTSTCTATASATKEVTLEANTVAGTLSVENSPVCSTATTDLPKVKLTGHTGTINPLTFTCGGNTVTKSNADIAADSSYTLTKDELDRLLAGTTGRDLTVNVAATVKSGTCPVKNPTEVSIKIYRPVPEIQLNTHGKIWCELPGSVELKQKDGSALSLFTGESIKWERIGTVSSENTEPATMNTFTPTGFTITLNTTNYPYPKQNADTAYWFRATLSSATCPETETSVAKQIVLRQPVKPTLNAAPTAVCEGSQYTVSVNRPGASDLVWKEVKGGTDTEISGVIPYDNVTGLETLTVSSAVTGTHTYKVFDVRPAQGTCAELLSAALEITVTVNEKPVAGHVSAASGGVFCASENVVVNHVNASVIRPAGGTINWQVGTDSTTYPASQVANKETSGSATAGYSVANFAAGTYFIRYEVPANGDCEAAHSNWAEVKVINKPDAPTIDALTTVCEGSDVTITIKNVANGLNYVLYANTTNATTGGTGIKSGKSDGTAITHTISPVTTNGTGNQTSWYYYVTATDASYTGTSTTCNATTMATPVELKVDAKPQKGSLVFASNNGKTLDVNAGTNDNLKLTDAPIGSSMVWYAVASNGTDYGTPAQSGQITNGGTRLESFGLDRMAATMYWVVTTNGTNCSPVNSDTVVVTVKSATDPSLTVTSPIICEGSDAKFTVIVPDLVTDVFEYEKIVWQHKGPSGDWEPATVTGITKGNLNATSSTVGLAPGEHLYRYTYTYSNGNPGGTSNEVKLQIDAKSKSGSLSADVDKVCENGLFSPLITVTGDQVGETFTWQYSKNGTTWTASSHSGSASQLTWSNPQKADSGWYKIVVTNGVCPPASSDSVLIRVISKPVAGTLTGGTVCYNDETASGKTTVALNGNTGASITWSTSSQKTSGYTPVPNLNQLSYPVGPLKDRLWVTVTVNTDADVCEAVTSEPVAVNVYDTLVISQHPGNVTVVGSGQTATFTVAAKTAGLVYGDNSNEKYTAVLAGGCQWYNSTDGGTTWSQITNGGDYSGAVSASLTVSNAENHADEMFYWVVTSNPCGRSVTSNSAKISAMEKLAPGSTQSLTQCACYYPTDQALYYVKDAAGQGTLYYQWQVSTRYSNAPPSEDAHWQNLTDFDLNYTLSPAGDTIVFSAVGEVMKLGINWIRARVHDDYTTDWQGAESNLIAVCEQAKPTYTFEGNIVCERTTSGAAALQFAYTASADIDQRVITYLYRLPSDAGFSLIGKTQDPNSTVQTKTINVPGETLALTFNLSNDNLTIPATSAIPFWADSMIVRMEVRSCYTPDINHDGSNTDTTIDVLLRVDRPVNITSRAKDTIVFVGMSFNMETGYAVQNKTIAGNEVSAKWYQLGKGQKDSKTYDGDKDGLAVRAFNEVQKADSGVWYVDLATKYCPAVTDTINVDVHKFPKLLSINNAEVCKGEVVKLKVIIDADSPDDYTIGWEHKQEPGDSWTEVHWQPNPDDFESESLSSRTYSHLFDGEDTEELTINNIGEDLAGYYKVNVYVTGSDGTPLTLETTVRVLVVPDVRLDPGYPNRYKITLKEGDDRKVEVTWPTDARSCVTEAEPTKYEWFSLSKEESAFHAISSEIVKGNADGKEIRILAASKDFDSTLFYAKVTTGCGLIETERDTLRVTDQFAVTVSMDGMPACEGDEVIVVASTTTPAAYVEWQYATSNDAAEAGNWQPITMPSATYDSTWGDGTYTLVIHKVTAGMEGYVYRIAVKETETSENIYSAENDEWGLTGDPMVLHVDRPVKFTCTDVLAKTEPAVVIGGTPASSQFSFNMVCASNSCNGSDHACNVTYSYELSKPVEGVTQRNAYSGVGSGADYEFTPAEADTGFNLIRFSAGNHCGRDTAYDSVLVIMKPEPGPVTAIPTEPGKGPDDPIAGDVEGPSAKDITVEICEGNTLYLAATYTGGPASGFRWQVDGADIAPMASPYSLRHDTLVISPVAANIHNKVFRCKYEMPGNVEAIYSYNITVHVNRKPDAANTWVSIEDRTSVVTPALDTGQALPGGEVWLTAMNVPEGATEVCFYRAFKNESGEVDSVVKLACVTDSPFEYKLTDDASVEEHDATWYYAQVHNDCGYDSTRSYVLRVFEDLKVVWIPDTLVPRPNGEYDIDTVYPEPKPGDLVILFGPGENPDDTVQLEAHLWVCQNDRLLVRDTTLSGFMNPEVYTEYEVEEEGEEPERGSRWYYRESENDEWKVIRLNREPWVDMLDFGVDLTVQEHEGNINFPLPLTPDMDGWQFKAWGMNARYDDSSCILTLHVIPAVKHGDIEMNPAVLCEEPGAKFELISEKDLSKLTIDWQVKTDGSDAWSDNIELLHNDTIYQLDREGLPANVREVRAIVDGACGGDTIYGIIRTPVVRLTPDSVCEGSELVLTATTENLDEPIVFEWFVDGGKDASATGAEYKTSSLPAGAHNIEVRASDALCASSDKADVLIYGLPQIEAFIADTMMKNIDTTSVWVKGQGNYDYAWTPETGLFDAKADSTLLSGLEPQEEPYWYVVTATDENGCQSVDSVKIRIESNFTVDSFSIVVVVPPVLDLDGGTLPGYPDNPDDSYYPELGGTPFGGELIFRDDTVADLWICAHNTALIHFNVRGGEKPITYKWTINDGNATLVYPVDAHVGAAYSFNEPDSVFGIFFPDTTTHTLYCEIKDKTGAGADITIYVHYYRPEMFYLEVTPKVTSGKYYEQQAMNFFVRPDRDWLTTWVEIRNGRVVDTVTNRNMNRQASFTKEVGDETSIWISTVDRHGCRIWDSVPIHIIPLPNVLLLGDPMNGVIFPEFEVEITNSWGLKVKAFEDRNGNGTSRGWDGRTKSGTFVVAGTYYYRAKVPTLDKKGYMIVNGAVTVVNK